MIDNILKLLEHERKRYRDLYYEEMRYGSKSSMERAGGAWSAIVELQRTIEKMGQDR